eukprot:TCONS_00029157-protein
MDVIQFNEEFYCSKCFAKFSKKFNAQRHYRNAHGITQHQQPPLLTAEVSSHNELDDDRLNDSDTEMCEDHYSLGADGQANEAPIEHGIDQLIAATMRTLQFREDDEADSSSDQSDDEVDELSIDDDWVFDGSKISIKEHASSVLG